MDNSYSKYLSVPVSTTRYYFILFLLWPFLAFLIALKNYNHNIARKIVYLFLIYYGLNFVLNSQGYVDAIGYVKELEAYARLPLSKFSYVLKGIYNNESSVDVYQPLITFLVSRFTNNYRILFAVFAAVFAFFYLKSINLLYELYKKKPGLNALIHLIFFIVILPITEINGVRMWTAAWIYFYGAIQVIMYHDKRYLFIALASSLVHFSFIAANFILLIYFFAGNRNIIYFPILITSFFFPQIITPLFNTISMRFGGAIQTRYEGYTSEDYILARQDAFEQNVWFMQIGNDMVLYYFLFAIIVIQIVARNSVKENNEVNLFSFLLIFLAFVNFAKPIPSFGNRFQTVFILFATFYLILYFLKINNKNINILTLIGLFPMILYAAIAFRIGSTNINVWLFIPGFGLPWLAPGYSVADLLFF